MRQVTLFLLLALILTSCSKQAVEKKIIYKEPLKKEIPGIIPEDIIKKAEKKYDKYVRRRYEAFNTKIRELQNSSTKAKLEEINKFFNRVPYVDDINIWGKNDYWATPLEFLGRDKGDCEDYVIAKYFALKYLGVDDKKLYFAYVKSLRLKKAHMVLSYFETPSSVPLILDSINFKIFPADKRKDLIPVYNFNGKSLYHARQKWQNGQKVINNEKTHKKWNKLVTEKVHKRWDRLLYDIKRNKL